MVNLDDPFFREQILTYIGNKRKLLGYIQKNIDKVKSFLNKPKLKTADLFSGSGIVARLLKENSSFLLVNDIEDYTLSLNKCYLANFNELDYKSIQDQIDFINHNILDDDYSKKGIISSNYAPNLLNPINKDDRVFYTPENALFIDSTRNYIENYIDKENTHFILAPLLIKASIHVNTSGVFKSFYRKNGVGQFGGKNQDALKRILGRIYLEYPIFSRKEAEIKVYSREIFNLLEIIKGSEFDLIYLDPPYNQHPYGSNYFMLNIIFNNRLDSNISRKSGIPNNWKRSSFYRKTEHKDHLGRVLEQLPTKYILLSYSEGGFIDFSEMLDLISKYGKINIMEIPYTIFRGCRNINKKAPKIKEYIFLIEKK